jgi:hypothetical protein
MLNRETIKVGDRIVLLEDGARTLVEVLAINGEEKNGWAGQKLQQVVFKVKHLKQLRKHKLGSITEGTIYTIMYSKGYESYAGWQVESLEEMRAEYPEELKPW